MRQCANCGKGSQMGGTRRLLRGHYNPTTKSRKYPNLQLARLPLRGTSGQAKVGGVRKLICVQCIKTLNRKPRAKKTVK